MFFLLFTYVYYQPKKSPITYIWCPKTKQLFKEIKLAKPNVSNVMFEMVFLTNKTAGMLFKLKLFSRWFYREPVTPKPPS